MEAVADQCSGKATKTATWDEIVFHILKSKEIRLITYVPDKVLKPLIDRVEADDYFHVVCPAREEEALGIVCGAQMAGMRGILLTQTSGFATLANVLASLPVPYEIPMLMMISERGALGDRQLVQVRVWQTMRPILEALGIPYQSLTAVDEVGFVVEETINQAFATRAPAALILSPLLTKKMSD
ncbi:decarboxylase [Alcaligenaceae bacterium]|nr:decarboxylase [Alcaligenaceae bacterium]